jgi:hypothetical protein
MWFRIYQCDDQTKAGFFFPTLVIHPDAEDRGSQHGASAQRLAQRREVRKR